MIDRTMWDQAVHIARSLPSSAPAVYDALKAGASEELIRTFGVDRAINLQQIAARNALNLEAHLRQSYAETFPTRATHDADFMVADFVNEIRGLRVKVEELRRQLEELPRREG